MCEWRGQFDLSYQCRLPPLPGSNLCIFHHRGDKDPAEFAESLRQQEVREAEDSNPPYDYTGYVFPVDVEISGRDELFTEALVRICPHPSGMKFDEAVFRYPVSSAARTCIVGGVSFRGTVFEDVAFFEGTEFRYLAEFEQARFEKHALFARTRFAPKCHAPFTEAVFADEADFRNAVFGNVAEFVSARFEGETHFRASEFHAAAEFMDVRFSCVANFRNAVFNCDVNFFRAIFGQGATFLDARFGGGVFFRGAQLNHGACFRSVRFAAKVEFAGAVLRGDMDFGECTFGDDAIFKNARFLAHPNEPAGGEGDIRRSASFCRSEFEETADFEGVHSEVDMAFSRVTFHHALVLSGAKLQRKCEFDLCTAGALRLGQGKPTIRWNWGTLRSLAGRGGLEIGDLPSAAAFWRFARETYQKEGDRERADAAHYLERMTSISPWTTPWSWTTPWREGSRSERLWATVIWLGDCLLLRWTMAYGASMPRLIFLWLAAVAFLLAVPMCGHVASAILGLVVALTSVVIARKFMR